MVDTVKAELRRDAASSTSAVVQGSCCGLWWCSRPARAGGSSVAVGLEPESMRGCSTSPRPEQNPDMPVLFRTRRSGPFQIQIQRDPSHEVLYLLEDLDATFRDAICRCGLVACSAPPGGLRRARVLIVAGSRCSPGAASTRIRYSKTSYVRALAAAGFEVEARRLGSFARDLRAVAIGQAVRRPRVVPFRGRRAAVFHTSRETHADRKKRRID